MQRKTSSNVFRMLLPMIIIIGVQYLATFFMSEVLFMFNVATFRSGGVADLMDNMTDQMLSLPFLIASNAIYAIICLIVFGNWYWRLVRANKENWPKIKISAIIIPALLLLAIGSQYIGAYLMEAVAAIFPPEIMSGYEKLVEQMQIEGDNASIVMMIYVGLIAPIVEELGCRGISFNYARSFLPMWAANIIQALMFAVLHGNPIQMIYTFLFALVLGYVYAKCGKIIVPIILHMLFNSISVLANNFIIVGHTPVMFFSILLASMFAIYAGLIMTSRVGTQTAKETE